MKNGLRRRINGLKIWSLQLKYVDELQLLRNIYEQIRSVDEIAVEEYCSYKLSHQFSCSPDGRFTDDDKSAAEEGAQVGMKECV